MKVVVVESPAKAKTINKYLGSDFHVLASFGHIRDLPPKDGSVRPDEDFAMDWETDPKSEKHVKEIAAAVKGAEKLFLATDPDREGEAISWHVKKVLEDRKALKGVEVKRVVFNEITKTAVLDAMKKPRDIDQELVDAYLARRALDYLVGFTLSPVLWRKLPGSRSAGRVQSVALRLICQRESEIESFKSQEYWTIAADFQTPKGAVLSAALTHLDGKKLDKFDLPTEAAARAAEKAAAGASYTVGSVERKRTKRNPYPPFTTSTLQQEASRKLYFGAQRTMQLAQRLYEGVDIGGETVGLITYMRTDGVQMAAEAIAGAREVIGQEFGPRYVPDAPRLYKTKAKNAQEAHEAIRPTDLARKPEDVARYLDKDQLRLYELVWKRTIASQMASAELDQVAVDIASNDHKITFRATGSVVVFDGFMKVYQEDRDDSDEDEAEKLLPDVAEKDAMARKSIKADQHFTQPPPRFSEASLVKRMEELGIGRPSTYASILTVLQDRNYVKLDARRFIPEDRGRLVTAFLESFFGRYVEYNFTAELENQLDDISGGRIQWKRVLDQFWKAFSGSVDETKDLRVTQVLDALDELLGPHFFPDNGSGHDPRSCPTCTAGRLSLKLGKFGAFIGCSAYPECRFTRPLTTAENAGDEDVREGPKELGTDPVSTLPVTLRKGPYGYYVQLGDESTLKAPEPAPEPAPPAKGKKAAKPKVAKAPKPKRVSLFRGLEPADVTLSVACQLLALPREVGPHPETKLIIKAGVGKFGPYLMYDGGYKSLAKGDDVLTIGMNRAVELLAQAKGRSVAAPLKTLGEVDGKPVTLHEGKYGPYVSRDGVHATLPKGAVLDAVTLDAAMELIKARAATKGTGKKAPAKKPAAKKPAAKKPAAKKAPAKKAPAKPKAKKAAE
ncbi:type I DNA topoisomerase [Paramagnetospirillum kuznetsovii]|uniref:DNA topoisomerase 1 n=1 Tax=Paramagnetospirillum kuznetsovii TaxID=2053833 RepID=A0A364P1R7_9PROT|nr:type I DNA topoisomerase [Paramagnetospirillum kuznetsovii]RAU23261.1 type I DNA topoisomerase [Paramagnetospirillum kuznetsovii]